MNEAFKEAKKAYNLGEVPIGAVIVSDGKIISRGYNKRESKQNALMHAEIIAIDKACKKLKSWRLENAIMYVSLEPCPMCAGAIAASRIKKVIYGCKEKSSGDNLCENILSSARLNHKVEIEYNDTLENEISRLLTQFFKEKRQKEAN